MNTSGELPHVLLIADDPIQRDALATALLRWGHDITRAGDTATALAWLAQMPANGRIILVDGRLHAREAIACCRSIRDQTAPACVHYLLILAEDDAPLLPEAFAVGASCMLMTRQDDDLLRARMLSISQRSQRQLLQLAHLQQLTDSHQRMKQELQDLAGIQQHWLPEPGRRVSGLDFDWVYRPAFIVSGDHFNLIPLSESQVGFCMIDVMGHGIAAAMRALEMARSLSLHPNEGMLFEPATATTARRLRTPAEVATLLNNSFKMTEVSPIYCTLIYGVLDTVTGNGAFVQAAHGGPVLIKPDGAIQTMGQGGFPIGLIDEPGYEDALFSLTPGDRFFLYSDGITESADAQGRIYGEQRLLTCLASLTGSARQQLGVLDNDITRWVGLGPLDAHHDDVSMLMLRYLGPDTGVVATPDELVTSARPAEPVDDVPVSDSRPSETIRTLMVTYASESVTSMLPVLAGRGLMIDLLPIGDEQLDRVVLSQYQLILLSWAGDLVRQRALLQRVIEVRQACPLYVLAFSLGNPGSGILDALQSGADDFIALPISMAELQCRVNAGRQWIARDRVLREELRRQQVLNEQVVTDLKMIEVFQKSRFPAQGSIHGNIEAGWLYAKSGDVMVDQLGITRLDDRHIAFYAFHSPVKSMLSLVALWAASRLVSHEIESNLLYEPGTQAGEPAHIRAPNAVIADLHQRFVAKPTAQFRCALTYGVIDTHTGKGQLAYAGETPPLLVSAAGAASPIAVSSAPLGSASLPTLMNHDVVLAPGDSLFLYGSALSSLASHAGQLLAESLAACHGQTTVRRTLSGLESEVARWRQAGSGQGSDDDISVLILQAGVTGPIIRTALSQESLRDESFRRICSQMGLAPEQAAPKSALHLSISALDLELALEAGKMVGEFASASGLSAVESYFMDVATVEATTNICRHGYPHNPGRIDIWILERHDGVLVRIIDHGLSIDESILAAARRYEFPEVFDDIERASEGGMGLPLIFKSMDRVHYHADEDGNSLLLFKRISGLSNLIQDR